ncbi:MAG: 3-deoxy-8-phosphooctulonate synthase [Synergistaceae bacterium]|jgi:2-dehydro-3-deoxyphosphooctonate aldolase (KDO 8-P synthase)|nr:3-deoxy-8-phosphooctulonate synthase [Synergistaceae bacterium]
MSGHTLGIGGDRLVIAAGPCMLESPELGAGVAEKLSRACEERGFGYIFKASFDKANRTSIRSERGPGLEKGLEWLAEIKREIKVPILTDIHEPFQAERVAEVADMLQIPAFLCRQTDLLVEASKTGRPINVKKAQFLAPEDMASVVEKCMDSGAAGVVLCERGTSFGYHRLVVDYRSLVLMRSLGVPVMFDATHSVQSPGGLGGSSGGDRRFVLPLVRAALAVGVDSVFLEVHPTPDEAKSDGPNMVPLHAVRALLDQIEAFDKLSRKTGFAGLDWL